MLARILAGAMLAALLAGAAESQTCANYPNTLTNGATADASQVMANFNSVLSCANTALAPVANPRFTGEVGIANASPTDVLDVAAGVVFGGTTGERLSLNAGSIGFNRHTSNGQIYDTSAYAYQWQHEGSSTQANDNLQLQVYNPSGGTVTDAAIMVNGLGALGVNSVPQSGYQLYVSGTAGGTAAWTTSSDARLKTNVREITGALDLVERLRGVRFDWRTPEAREVGKDLMLPVGEPQIGFIAQEVQKVVPEAVSTPKPGSDGVYGVKEDNLMPILVEAVKEQQAEIRELRAELAALQAKR